MSAVDLLLCVICLYKWECCSHWTENENEIVHNMKINITTLIVTFLLAVLRACESAPGLNARLFRSHPVCECVSVFMFQESRIRNITNANKMVQAAACERE